MHAKLKSKFYGVVLVVIVAVVFALPDRRAEEPTVSAVSAAAHVWVSPLTIFFEDMLSQIDHRSSEHISIYDEHLRSVSLALGNDWRLMAAIAYVESRFRYDVHSNTGAVGLMQIMPRVGRHYGCTTVELLDPRINIMVANMLYNDIKRMLKMPEDTPERDRMALALASYNGGIGHIFDALRLTRVAGDDPHLWSDVVPHLLSLRHETIYTNPVVRNGSFKTAGSTVRYVKDVLRKYDEYVKRTSEERMHLYPYAIRFDQLDLEI